MVIFETILAILYVALIIVLVIIGIALLIPAAILYGIYRLFRKIILRK